MSHFFRVGCPYRSRYTRCILVTELSIVIIEWTVVLLRSGHLFILQSCYVKKVRVRDDDEVDN
jgi:hypothetical protein